MDGLVSNEGYDISDNIGLRPEPFRTGLEGGRSRDKRQGPARQTPPPPHRSGTPRLAALRPIAAGGPYFAPARSRMACSSTSQPAARSSGVAFSISLWLMPFSQGTKIMPVGVTLAM